MSYSTLVLVRSRTGNYRVYQNGVFSNRGMTTLKNDHIFAHGKILSGRTNVPKPVVVPHHTPLGSMTGTPSANSVVIETFTQLRPSTASNQTRPASRMQGFLPNVNVSRKVDELPVASGTRNLANYLPVAVGNISNIERDSVKRTTQSPLRFLAQTSQTNGNTQTQRRPPSHLAKLPSQQQPVSAQAKQPQ